MLSSRNLTPFSLLLLSPHPMNLSSMVIFNIHADSNTDFHSHCSLSPFLLKRSQFDSTRFFPHSGMWWQYSWLSDNFCLIWPVTYPQLWTQLTLWSLSILTKLNNKPLPHPQALLILLSASSTFQTWLFSSMLPNRPQWSLLFIQFHHVRTPQQTCSNQH